MTTPTPTAGLKHQAIKACAEEQGPLVRQPAPAVRLANILHSAATDLWDTCTLTDASQMRLEANATARRILAASRRRP